MIAVLTHHWAKKDLYQEARILLDRNGSAQSRYHGFISRATFTSRTDTAMISSIVIWENDEIYDQWKSSPEREIAMRGATNLWAKPPISERCDVVQSL